MPTGGSDKLHEQLEELTNIVEELGGHTSFSDAPENEQAVAPIAAVVVKVAGTEVGQDE